MRKFKNAFTLIELLISVSILSMIMIYLYTSYANLNSSNKIIKKEVEKSISLQKIKKVFYLDFSLAMGEIIINSKKKNEDFVSFQSAHSLYQRFNPYITYIIKDKILYRLESLRQMKKFELSEESEFEVEKIGEVEIFRVYKSKEGKNFLLHIKLLEIEEILLKVIVLN